jgi:hypothetical protein
MAVQDDFALSLQEHPFSQSYVIHHQRRYHRLCGKHIVPSTSFTAKRRAKNTRLKRVPGLKLKATVAENRRISSLIGPA